MSFILPIILLIYKLAMPNRNLVRILYGLLIVGSTVLCYILTSSANVGALPFGFQPVSGIN